MCEEHFKNDNIGCLVVRCNVPHAKTMNLSSCLSFRHTVTHIVQHNLQHHSLLRGGGVWYFCSLFSLLLLCHNFFCWWDVCPFPLSLRDTIPAERGDSIFMKDTIIQEKIMHYLLLLIALYWNTIIRIQQLDSVIYC